MPSFKYKVSLPSRGPKCCRGLEEELVHLYVSIQIRLTPIESPPFEDPRRNRLFIRLRPVERVGRSVSTGASKDSGSSVNGRVVIVVGRGSGFLRDALRHPRPGDFDLVRVNLELTRASLESSSVDKALTRDNFGGGPLASI